MDRRQKKRILIFSLVPVLAAILFLTDDPVIRFITIAVIIIYVAFIIFLRDSIRFDKSFSSLDNEDDDAVRMFPVNQGMISKNLLR